MFTEVIKSQNGYCNTMSTVKQPLEYLWTAIFTDGHIINQPEDDRYSRYDENLEHNKSAFQDILDYQEKSRLYLFVLHNNDFKHTVYLDKNAKLIYYRNVEQKHIDGIAQDPEVVSYCVGYEYKDDNNKVQKKVIEINV